MIAQCLSCNRIVEVSTVYLWWKDSYHDKALCVCGNSSDTCCDVPIKFRLLNEGEDNKRRLYEAEDFLS